jgi:hypothetical protein
MLPTWALPPSILSWIIFAAEAGQAPCLALGQLLGALLSCKTNFILSESLLPLASVAYSSHLDLGKAIWAPSLPEQHHGCEGRRGQHWFTIATYLTWDLRARPSLFVLYALASSYLNEELSTASELQHTPHPLNHPPWIDPEQSQPRNCTKLLPPIVG